MRTRFFELALEAGKTGQPGRYVSGGNPIIAQALRETALYRSFTMEEGDDNRITVFDPSAKPKPKRRRRSTNKGKAAMKSAATEPYPPAR